MATIGTIAVNLTADARPLQGGLQVAKRSIDDFNRSTGSMRKSSMNGSMAFLELSRGVEDAVVGFGTNGLQGAVRGSLNNIAQFSMYLGGPMTAAITTFVAVGLSSLVTWWMKSGEASKDAKKAHEEYNDTLRQSVAIQMDAVGNRQNLVSAKTEKEASSQVQSLSAERERLAVEASILQRSSQTEDVARRRLEITQKDVQLQKDLEAAKARQLELAKKERAEAEFTKSVAEMYAKIRQTREDSKAGQGIIERAMQGVSSPLFEQFQKSMQIRELQNLNLPPEMQDALSGVIGGAFAARPQSTQLASFVREGSQEAAQMDFQDANRAKERELAKQAFDELKGIHDTLKDIERQNTPVQSDSINLD